MSNKVRKLLTHNRENFVKNKNTYYINKVITRRNHTFIFKRPLTCYGGGGPKPSLLLFVFITTSIGIYNYQKK